MSTGSRTRRSETDRPASGEMAWRARVAQPPIRSRPRRWRGRLLLVIGPLRIAPLLQRHSVAEEASAFGTRHAGVRAAGPLRVCSSTILHTVAPAPLSATGAIPVPRRDGIGVTAFVREQKPRAVQNRSPVCPSFVDAEATAIGEPHSQVLDLTNSRPRRGGRLALEADLLSLGERRAVDGDPEAQADVSRRLDAVQQLAERFDRFDLEPTPFVDDEVAGFERPAAQSARRATPFREPCRSCSV